MNLIYILRSFFLQFVLNGISCTDLVFFSHGHRSSTYGPFDYFGDFGNVVNAVNSDSNIPVKNTLIAPNLAGTWTPE